MLNRDGIENTVETHGMRLKACVLWLASYDMRLKIKDKKRSISAVFLVK